MKIENARFAAEIAELGAELKSLIDKRTGEELMWNADPKYWKRTSPVLFPNVGKTYGNTLRLPEGAYKTKQHGFARDSVFTLKEQTASSCLWALEDSEATRAEWPYAFRLEIGYTLKEDGMEVLWRVTDTGEKPFAFTIGGHPAFLLGGVKEGCAVEIPGKDSLLVKYLDPATGCWDLSNAVTLPLKDSRLALTEELFARDALICDGGQIEDIRLIGADGRLRAGLRCPGFPNFGIWSVAGAPFVCLEPWQGRADDNGFTGTPFEKPGAAALKPGETREWTYEIYR